MAGKKAGKLIRNALEGYRVFKNNRESIKNFVKK